MKNKITIGSVEYCNLPDIGIFNLPVRIDTGAKTSSLHVDNLEQITTDGKPWVTFEIHPNTHDVTKLVKCKLPIKDFRRIKSSNGTSEDRYLVSTTLGLGEQSWTIQLTLTDRSDMSYLMLLGRQGMGKRVLVDPSETFILTNLPEA